MIGWWKREYKRGKFFENTNNIDIPSLKSKGVRAGVLGMGATAWKQDARGGKGELALSERDDSLIVTSRNAKQSKDDAR